MKKSDQSGFSVIEALLILVVVGVVGFTGWYVYHAKQASDKDYSAGANTTMPTYKKTTKTTTTATTNIYAGWDTCDDTTDGISFKYPSTWTVVGATSNSDPCSSITQSGDSQEVMLDSPSTNGLSFQLWYFGAMPKANLTQSNSNSSTADWLTVHSVSPVTLNSGKALSLVSYEDTGTSTKSSDGLISEMGLSDQDYTVGQNFHVLGGITSPSNSNYAVNLYASLAPPGSQDQQYHSVADYESQPAYNDLMNIFKSVSY